MAAIRIDTEKCVGCSQCVNDCLFHVLKLVDGKASVVDERAPTCIQCGHCASVCKQGAVSLFGVVPELRSENRENITELIKTRRSVRQFKGPISNEEIKELVNIAKYAPSAKNERSVKFAVINRPKLTEVLSEVAKLAEKCEALPKELIQVAHAQQKFDLIGRGAPHMIIAYIDENSKYGTEDANIMLSEIELTAVFKGYGTFWCGFLKALLSVPGAMDIVGLKGMKCMQCLGLGVPAIHYHREVPRKDVDITIIE
ncbi:4Fe-4S ferredoxin-type domain-containing protein [Entamoeba marina]